MLYHKEQTILIGGGVLQRNEYMTEQFDGFVRVNDNYERLGSSLDLDQTMDVNMNGMNYIAAGQGMMLGRDWLTERNPDELTFVENSHLKYSKEVNDFVESDDCPTHYEYLRDYIYGGDELRAELI